MIPKLHIGRFLFVVTLALVMLLVGFILKDYLPMDWAQRLRVGPAALPTAAAQASRPDGNPTDPADAMQGMNNSGAVGTTLVPTTTPPGSAATPPPTVNVTRSAGIVTVITLTPTAIVTAAEPTNTSTVQAALTQEPPVPLGTATQVPAAVTQPTGTQTPAAVVPSFSSEPSPAMVKFRADLRDLYQMVQITRLMLETIRQGQPTGEERIALQAQLKVVAQRMEKLASQLQTAPSGAETSSTGAGIWPGQLRDLLVLMHQAVVILQPVLSDSAADSAILAQGQTQVEKLEGMLQQMQSLVAAIPGANQAGSEFTSRPTMMPSPTAAAPTATPTPASVTNNPFPQLQTMLSQTMEILGQMQRILGQMQNQSGTGATPGANLP